MAEECTATSSSTPINWWTDVHASAWSTTTTTINNNSNNTWNPANPNSNSTCEDHEDSVSMSNNSFTNNASNQSGLSIDSSRRFADNNNDQLIRETPSDHHLWNHVLLNGGNNGAVQNDQDVGDNLLNAFSAKINLATGLMFDPACDYLKKMDSGWDFNNLDKNFNGFNETIFENERLAKLSNLVSNWSIAPPQPEINCQFGQQSSNISLSSSTQYQQTTVNDSRMSGLNNSSYGHDRDMLKLDEHRSIDQPLIGRPVMDNGVGYQTGLNNSMNEKYYYGLTPADMSFGSCLSKPLMDVGASKTINMKNNFYSSDTKKQSVQPTYPKFQTFSSPSSCTVARNVRRGRHYIVSEGKKKRSDNYEDNLDTNSKKPKHDNTSSALPSKPHAPKAKLADKITALQHIVSPFGKTDTASVLWEAIGYIKCLQDQVEQCLNSPYLKNNSLKEQYWGGFDIKSRGDGKLDLKSRGLCLVPISSTPSIYRDASGTDFWTSPAYRGFLYR